VTGNMTPKFSVDFVTYSIMDLKTK